MIVDIYIGNDKLELFEDENISVTSSVLDIQDISKNTTDYSNAFTVPASEINNKIFKHYYDANIDNTFDARVSVDGRIEIGGMPFRLGKILLQKVIVKRGVASAYTINFWGNLVSLKDVLGDDKLSDLDLSAYDHPYTSNSVYTLLTVAGIYPSLVYNLLVKKQYYYNSLANDVVMTDEKANIHYKVGTENGVMWDDLRPSIALFQIINAIEADYGLTFSDDFFGLDKFKKLYMWVNNTSSDKIKTTPKKINWTNGENTWIDFATDIGTYYTKGEFLATSNSRWFMLETEISPLSGYEDIEYTINFFINDDVIAGTITGKGNIKLSNNLTASGKAGGEYTYNVYWEIYAAEYFEYTSKVTQTYWNGTARVGGVTTGGDTVSSTIVISENMPDLKIIDFLKGLFNAYKLVVIPQDDGTIYIDTVENYYDNGQTLDITNYIDAEQLEVSRGNILNTINYNFEEPQTILNQTFKANTGLAYGDEEAQLRDDSGKLLDGGTLEIKLPFEQIVYERLNDISGVDTINLMYGAIIDKELKPVNIKPHVFYNQRKRVGGNGIGFITDSGTKTAIRGEINTPSHTIDDDNPTDSFIFSSEFNNFTGGILRNNLYSNYHSDYIDSIFNVKRRNFKFKTKILPVSILLDLTLNDVIKIGYNYYRIDKFTTNLTSGETELNLVNLV